MKTSVFVFCFSIMFIFSVYSQPDTITIGFGGYESVSITNSDTESFPENTLNQAGFLPNMNAASRFLSQAALGYNFSDVQNVTLVGIEDWIDAQMAMPMPYTLIDKVDEYFAFTVAQTGSEDAAHPWLYWEYAWWQYHMENQDLLRQRVALALSEILVISDKSEFGGWPYALADYYDILLRNAFGNYRDILDEVTYHPSMGVYLTYMGNPKTDLSENRFPDENYAREVMQLFTIGLFELNLDGTRKLDGQGNPIPTYDNDDIAEFSKIFTGLTWGDGMYFFSGPPSGESYLLDMQMREDYHEPGVKNLLNGFQVPNRNPVDGKADIADALDNLFNHPNVGPFISQLLIQRLVTSNPPPEYIARVATVFNDNGQGIRGDMGAVVKAILLDPLANNCESAVDVTFGKLREPFIRYVQVNKAFNVSTLSGNFRNVMYNIEDDIGQKPLASPSVFNFFQPDYQPLGPVEEQDLVAPEFQITDAQTISGYLNAVYDWIFNDNIADEWQIYQNEPEASFADERSSLNFSEELMLVNDDEIHILLDRLNMLLAGGRLSLPTLETIKNTVIQFPNEDLEDQEVRAKLAIYLVLSSPEYLISR